MCVCVMPTHCSEEGVESTTKLLKFKGEVCLYYNSLMKMKTVVIFKSGHVYEPTWQTKDRTISTLSVIVLGRAGKAG